MNGPTAIGSQPVAEAALAECHRLTGVDAPDGVSDTLLATSTTAEVRRLRFDHDALAGTVDKLVAAIRLHRQAKAGSSDAADARLWEALDPNEEYLADAGL